MIDDIDLKNIRKVRRIGYYFRYPLHRSDFHELTLKGKTSWALHGQAALWPVDI